jgi:myosin heavy subunit
MSEYVIDYETPNMPIDNPAYNNGRVTYWFKIHKHGNIEITSQRSSCIPNQGTHFSQPERQLLIEDNIPIPNYLIEMLKTLINTNGNEHYLYHYHWGIVLNTIKQLKTSLKELSNNPQDAKDMKTQLEFSLNKNELLETQLTEMEQKIKNIQTAYFDTLKDNEKLKEEINRLKEKNKNIENELKNKKDTVYVNVPVENPKPRSLRDAFHNPGGATIYTKSNAANRMVYNEDTELWEHEEN